MCLQDLWQDYVSKYNVFALSLSQTGILDFAARETLKEFPKNLPEELIKPLVAVLEKLNDALDAKKKHSEEEGLFKASIEVNEAELLDPHLFFCLFDAIFNNAKIGEHFENMDFEQLLSYQEIVMLIAHLDAFFSDSIRAICMAHPEMLNRKKQVTWEEVLQFRNREEIIHYLSEKYVYDFGMKTFPERINKLKERHGLDVQFSSEDLDFLEEVRNVRHIIVHNGGRISSDFLSNVKSTAFKLGAFVSVTSDYKVKAYDKIRLFADELFRGVSKKFFKIEESAFHTILYRERKIRYGQAEITLQDP
jgi:hypothetical protein